MSTELINRALRTATDTRAIRYGSGVIAETGEVFRTEFPGKRVLIVADENTFAAAGQQAVEALHSAGIDFAAEPYIFPRIPTLYPTYEMAEKLKETVSLLDNTILCAIGAGSLNDLVKLVAGMMEDEYLVVCTAASVDGYASFGASVSKDGYKITRPCPAPAAIIADLDILVAAPAFLSATGYGDLIEKVPAGLDWALADVLGIEKMDQYTWDLVQVKLRESLDNPAGVATGDPHAIFALGEASIMSGLAMQAYQSSRPASGAGHQFSSVWEMEGYGLDWDPPLSHGYKVGIGTVASCALWEIFLSLDPSEIDPDRAVDRQLSVDRRRAKIERLLEPRLRYESFDRSMAKHVEGNDLYARISLLRENWTEFVEFCKPRLLTPDDIASRLRKAGAPSHPNDIDMDLDRLKATYYRAQVIRDRYTILDIFSDLGILEETVEGLFSEQGYWGNARA